MSSQSRCFDYLPLCSYCLDTSQVGVNVPAILSIPIGGFSAHGGASDSGTMRRTISRVLQWPTLPPRTAAAYAPGSIATTTNMRRDQVTLLYLLTS